MCARHDGEKICHEAVDDEVVGRNPTSLEWINVLLHKLIMYSLFDNFMEPPTPLPNSLQVDLTMKSWKDRHGPTRPRRPVVVSKLVPFGSVVSRPLMLQKGYPSDSIVGSDSSSEIRSQVLRNTIPPSDDEEVILSTTLKSKSSSGRMTDANILNFSVLAYRNNL